MMRVDVGIDLDENCLKQTTSLCPECNSFIPAVVLQRGQQVLIQKTCPSHGTFEALIASDDKYYHLSMGADESPDLMDTQTTCGASCDCSPVMSFSRDPKAQNPADQTATCIALIEIVDDCNLTCPTCYAGSSPPEAGTPIQAMSIESFHQRLDAVVAKKGPIDVLQLSGGEPTIHPDFFELLETALKRQDVLYVLLNTNGILLANRQGFAQRLGKLRDQYGKFELYLQFDGPQEDGQVMLRGQDLRQVRQRVIEQCTNAKIPLGLAMTVDQHNRNYLGQTLQLALENPIVRGISFQPMFGSGRAYQGVNEVLVAQEVLTINGQKLDYLQKSGSKGGSKGGSKHFASIDSEKHDARKMIKRPATERLSVGDLVKGLVSQSEGLLKEEDFTPLPCGDPNCHTVGYLVRTPDAEHLACGVNQFVDFESMQGFLKDRVDYNLEDLMQCGCESTDLGLTLKALEIGPESVLRLFIKPFMDAWTYDQHRVDRCCVHVVGSNGSLTSFCQHYALA